MNKKVIANIIKGIPVKDTDLSEFVVNYIEYKKRPEPKPEQLALIMQLVKQGHFNVVGPANEVATSLSLQVVRVIAANGMLLKTDVYDLSSGVEVVI
jgi:hypothetical protein